MKIGIYQLKFINSIFCKHDQFHLTEDPVDNDKDFMINWDRDEDEDTSQDEVIPLEDHHDDDEDQWDGDNNVNLKVDEYENDALWEGNKLSNQYISLGKYCR